MSIYDDPQQYAKETYITLEQAETRCKHFKNLEKRIEEARKCPKCGAFTLNFEGGSYEEGIRDSIYCGNGEMENANSNNKTYFDECEFNSEITDQFAPLLPGYDFDIVSSFGLDIKRVGLEKVEKQIGCSWQEFVEESIKDECIEEPV